MLAPIPSPRQDRGQRLGLGHRLAAGEAAADEGGRLAPEREATLQERHAARRGVRADRDDLARPPAEMGRAAARDRSQPRRPRVGRFAHDRDLVDRTHQPVDRRRATGRTPSGSALAAAPTTPMAASAASQVPALAGQGGQPQEHRRRHRAARRDGVVLERPRARDQRLRVVGRVEEAAGRVGEVDEDRVDRLARGDEPTLVAGRLVQREEALGHAGLVLQRAGMAGAAVLPRAQEPPVGRSQHVQQAIRGTLGERQVPRRPRRRGPGSPSRARSAAASARRRSSGRSSRPAPCRRAPAGAVGRGQPSRATRARSRRPATSSRRPSMTLPRGPRRSRPGAG